MATLPGDVLLCICEELSNQQEFGTLFNCATTGKSLAGIALGWLYKIHHLSPVISSEGNDAELTKNQGLKYSDRVAEQKKMIAKWALQWKSVLRSGLGQTLYPYGLYIRVLDLRNLTELLEESLFREFEQQDFFSGEMAQFLKVQETPVKRKRPGTKGAYTRLNIPLILDAVGESLTQYVDASASQNHSTVALEDLSGNINAESLPRWTSRLSKLKSLTLWDGGVLDASVATSISTNCYDFDDLTFYGLGDDKDATLSSFLSALRPNTLRSFTALSAGGVGPETLLALNNHSKSLRILKLNGLELIGIKNLNLLQGCESLEVLELIGNLPAGYIDLKNTENDVFLEIVAWLRKCVQLRELSLEALVSSPLILTEICLCNDIKLRKLVVDGYLMVHSQNFHRSLSHQTSLEHLHLKADAEGSFRDDIDILIHSISQLPQLKYLNILNTSEYFQGPDIQSLVPHLKNLEELWFSGYDVDDRIWQPLSGLHQLRVLNVLALSYFTLNGCLAFISTLKPTNQGLLLAAMNQATTHGLSEAEQTIVRNAIKDKVGGSFDFVLFREDDSESEIDSD
ncbi:hypothetical protein LSUE1_G001881 [Lachnellula suecica]|uniref:Uncharacterized protein n=1 Tax=Lachnellula suecica TaxID=602035 RepID=A0A8T9CFF8_9HELO|nr:hypothetical protein LSUE1_G001881 [Lachnellula suecica]